MHQVIRIRNVDFRNRPSKSPSFKVETKGTLANEELSVNITLVEKNSMRTYYFRGEDLAGIGSVHFYLDKNQTLDEIRWSGAQPYKVTVDQNIRLLRITWNENNWEFPSRHKWTKTKQGDSNVAHENQYGFGGEEWLFNQRYNIGGYQYGFIQGLWQVMNTDFIDVAYLFSINQATKERFLIGKINNVELLDSNILPPAVVRVFEKHKDLMVAELIDADADISKFNVKQFYPIMRFKMADAEIFDKPQPINELANGQKYNRFKPYIVDEALQSLLDGKMVTKPFVFAPGKRKNENAAYTKTSSGKSSDVKGLHAQIVTALAKYLEPDFSITLNNTSIEKTAFGDNIADLVTQHKDKSYSIYEVKTSHNTRYNIREAIGQLLDYALWYDTVKIKDLVIVAPCKIKEDQLQYLKRIRANLKMNLRYIQCIDLGKCEFKEVDL